MTQGNEGDPILVLVSDGQVRFLLERILANSNYEFIMPETPALVESSLSERAPILAVLSEDLPGTTGIEYAAQLTERFPGLPVILFVASDNPELMQQAMIAGVSEILHLPVRVDDITRAVDGALNKGRRRRDWIQREARKVTSSLRRQVDELETITQIGRSITSTFNIDAILTQVVDAAVRLTNAEEGSMLMLDEETGELYMRAARNFQEEFVRTFRLKVSDTLVSTVLQTGVPYLLDDKTPQKIKTAYLVHSLIYVPLKIHGKVVGVLGVDNRMERMQFHDHEVKILHALADYASIALQNSRLYEHMLQERNKLETILAKIHDGVIVLDQDRRLMLVNRMAQALFNLDEVSWIARPFAEVFTNPDLLALVQNLDAENHTEINYTEIHFEDGHVFAAVLTPIPEVGVAITLHDVTNLKKIDRIKSDFVSTVSHDLRSPLTAIMGYVELIERAGPVNDSQHDFILKVMVSVQNITHLVDDLLNLGRIEAGFDVRKEVLQMDRLVSFSLDGFKKPLADKNLSMVFNCEPDLPGLYANPVQMRQMVENLIDNAIKYTPIGGQVTLSLGLEVNQIIFRVSDSGIGIPTLEIPYIFDKFYRASNTGGDVVGTGLGLSIVKSIVEYHQGRIWVDSGPGQGTTFTVVLPVVER